MISALMFRRGCAKRMSANTYVMSEKVARKCQPVCHSQHCGKPIKPGDRTLSKTNGTDKRKWYHEDCYESLFLEL